MGDKDDERFMASVVARDMTSDGDAPEYTDADRDYVRRNPQLIAKLLDPLEVKKRYLYVMFIIAIGMALISKVIEYTNLFADQVVLRDILTNVQFSISIELFGAATVAFVMELVFQRRVQRNQDLVKTLIAEQDPDGEPESTP